MKKTLILALLPVALAACSPTKVSFLDRIYKVEEFDQNTDLRQRTVAECNSNPGVLKDDPNCVNAHASKDKADAKEAQEKATKAAAALAMLMANPATA